MDVQESVLVKLSMDFLVQLLDKDACNELIKVIEERKMHIDNVEKGIVSK